MADHAHSTAVTTFLLFHFHKVAQVRYLGKVNMFFVCKSVLPEYSSAKIIKNQTSFSRVMITNVLPLFYESQCRVWLHYDLYAMEQHGVL